MNKLAILHIGGLSPESGGPSQTLAQLVAAQAALTGLSVTVLSQSLPGAPLLALANPAVALRVQESASPLALKLGLPVRQALAAWLPKAPPDILFGHGLWLPVNHWTAQAARRYGIPLIMHTHGMLKPWALHHKALKKRLALALYQSRDLQTARVLIASSPTEYAEFRALGLRHPIAIMPNGVPLPAADAVRVRPPRPAGAPRIVLFLGRIYPVKGLLNLIDAWAQVRPFNWRLQIAGPDEAGHLAEVLARAREAGVTATVDYVGPVDDTHKSAVYQAADVVVLPSFTENFGMVVAEALAHGLPVITTHGTPWADLPAFKCGWWIPVGVEPLAGALREALALSDAERAVMGARGLAYVRRYDWAAIAEDMAAVCRWVLGQGERPGCVRVD